MAERKPTVWDWLGFTLHPDFAKARALGRLIGVVMFLAAVVILIGPLARLFQAIWVGDDEAVRNLGFLLAALIGAPFVIWRSVVAQKQANIAEDDLTTDLINKAVEGLGAQKEVNRIGRTLVYDHDGATHRLFEWRDEPHAMPDGAVRDDAQTTEWKPFAETRPNIEVRTGAILALERLSKKVEDDEDYKRIMEILCAYLRENFRCESADPEIAQPDDEADAAVWGIYREELAAENARLRVKPLTDLATALEVLKRRDADCEGNYDGDGNWDGYRLDLRGIDLRRSDLSIIALLRANLGGSQMQGADLFTAQMKDADLRLADMEGADLRGSNMQGAGLFKAQMKGTDLLQAQMEGADLRLAEMQGAYLGVANLRGADLREAKMQGANLFRAEMQGANLRKTEFSDKTILVPATLRGAGLKSASLAECSSDPEKLPGLLADAFGDATVNLPDGLEAGEPPLEHWSREELDDHQFEAQWRAFQKRIGYDPARPST